LHALPSIVKSESASILMKFRAQLLIDVIGRSPYRWDFSIMDIPIYVICSKYVQIPRWPECIAFTKTSI